MAYQISDACVSCGACESQCPVGAISMGDGKFEIDADKCIDCGSCAGADFNSRAASGAGRQRKGAYLHACRRNGYGECGKLPERFERISRSGDGEISMDACGLLPA